MNKYGYFTFFDGANETEGTVAQNYAIQGDSSTKKPVYLFNFDEPQANNKEYATFEPGNFDFEKPLWYSSGDIPSTSVDNSDAEGHFTTTRTITITPSEAYSGSGFSMRSFNKDYNVTIQLTDITSTRSKTFDKTDDEWYVFPFDGLTSVSFTFNSVEPYHLLKAYAVSLNHIRQFGEEDIVDEPEIVTHFSLTGEELEYDTLNLSIVGTKEECPVFSGEKLIYNPSGRIFYVDSAKFENDGTISISAYNLIALLDQKQYDGFFHKYKAFDAFTQMANAITAYGEVPDTVNFVRNDMATGQQCGFFISPCSCRDALRQLCIGNRVALKSIGSNDISGDCYQLLRVNTAYSQYVHTFTEDDIVSELQIEKEPYIDKILVTVPTKILVEPTEVYETVFEDTVPAGVEQIMKFDTPSKTTTSYNASLQTYFTVVKDTASVFIFVTDNTGTIAVNRYKYDTQEQTYSYQYSDIPSIFKGNNIERTDFTVTEESGTFVNDLMNYLSYCYEFRTRVTFDSIIPCTAGDIIRITVDNIDLNGWIVTKTDRMNGVYTYEVMCR